MKKGLKKFNISNRLAYTLILILSIVLLGVGVYAVVPNPGHSLSEIEMPTCSSFGQSLTWNGNAWVCINPIDARFTVNQSGLCYDAPATCTLTTESCDVTATFSAPYPNCDYEDSSTLRAYCLSHCGEHASPCDGRNPFYCEGGTLSSWNAISSCIGGGTMVLCGCSSSSYQKENYIPQGLVCVHGTPIA